MFYFLKHLKLYKGENRHIHLLHKTDFKILHVFKETDLDLQKAKKEEVIALLIGRDDV